MAGSCEHGNEKSRLIKWWGISGLAEKTTDFLRRTVLHGVGILQLNISRFVMNTLKVIYKCSLLFIL